MYIFLYICSMSNTILNATNVRNDFFRLLDEVEKSKKPIYIKKDNKIKVKLDVIGTDLTEKWDETRLVLEKLFGMWKDRSEGEISKKFRKANIAAAQRFRMGKSQ